MRRAGARRDASRAGVLGGRERAALKKSLLLQLFDLDILKRNRSVVALDRYAT